MSHQSFYLLTRPQKLFVVCTGIFLTALVVAEATASKLFVAFHLPFDVYILGQKFDAFVMTAGVISFPVTFIVTDLMNEYFGKRGIRFVTWLGMAMICFQFVLIQLSMAVPTAPISGVSEQAFNAVFGASGRIIVGSLTAYLIGQLVDIALFHWLRDLTKGKYLWLRATGSTFGSQFFDTFVVLGIAFGGIWTIQLITAVTIFNYIYKFLVAIAITPVIYGAHWVIDRYLGAELSHELTEHAEHEDELTDNLAE
jgi:uncharacterized integral membrane protein (TIGR00697 family)